MQRFFSLPLFMFVSLLTFKTIYNEKRTNFYDDFQVYTEF